MSAGRHLGPVPVVLVAVVLAGAVLASVHHAEVVAHRVGEPYGSLVPGRATRLQGAVHLAIFGAFVFLSISP